MQAYSAVADVGNGPNTVQAHEVQPVSVITLIQQGALAGAIAGN